MDHYVSLVICYCLFFTIVNFGVFLTCYLFGFTYDRELRTKDNRIFLPPFSRFFFYFKGVQSSSRSRPTKLCGGAEIFSFCYFILMELANVLIAMIFNDFVLSCRISFAFFVIILIAVLIITMKVKKKIKTQNKKNDEEELNEYLTPKETIDINNDQNIDKFLSEPHEKPDSKLSPVNMLDNEDFETETADVSQGMEAVNQMKEHLIIDNAQENEIVANIFSQQNNIEEESRDTADFSEGMKKIKELRDNPIDNDF